MDVKKCERIPLLARQGPALVGPWRASSVVWLFCAFDTLSFCHFEVLLLYLSLRYGADLCRSRFVSDVPGPPGPIEYPATTNESITLKWTPPIDDGGALVTNYVIAKKDVNKTTWSNVTSSVTRTQYTVQGLAEKQKYEFKVCAENQYGVGDPSFGEPVVAKNPFDPPDPPKNVVTKDVTKSSVKLEWEKPHKDGGKPIKGSLINIC